MKYPLLDDVNETPAGGGAPEGMTATPAPAPAPSGSDVDWEAESDPSDESEVVETTPKTPATAKVETPPAPAATPASPTPAPAAPATPTPSSTPAPAPAATPAVPEPQPSTPEPAPAPAPDFAALRDQEATRLTSLYALSDDQARGMLVEPEKHIPALLANAHLRVAEDVIRTVMSQLPAVVNNLTQQASSVQKAEQEFYATWPMLNDPKYTQMVSHAIQMYRGMNPKATRQETIRAAGLNALISLRLPIPRELLIEPPAVPSETLAPGFVHAAPGAGGMPQPAKPQPSAFQLLNQEFDEEER